MKETIRLSDVNEVRCVLKIIKTIVLDEKPLRGRIASFNIAYLQCSAQSSVYVYIKMSIHTHSRNTIAGIQLLKQFVPGYINSKNPLKFLSFNSKNLI